MAYDPNDPFSDPNQDQPYQRPPEPQAPTQPSYADFQRDYWAPDRAAVLAQMAPSPQGPTMAAQLPGYTPPDLSNVVNGSYSPNTGVTGGYTPYAPPTPYAPEGAAQITQYYQRYLGRTPSAAEIQSHLANPGGSPGYRNVIANSAEAQAYAAAHPGGPGAAPSGAGPGASSAPSGASSAPFNYEKARDEWMSGKYGSGEAGARAWAAANGIQYNGGDTITLPNGGGLIDIIGNFHGGGRMSNNWTPAGGNGPNPGGQGGGGGAPGAFGGGGSATASGSYGITSGPLQDQYRATLLRMMQQGEQPVDENSLGIRQPYEAGRLAAERQLEQAQQANAERLYAEGQLGAHGSNELANLGQQGRERTAVGLAGLKSGLIQNEIGARRQQLQQALQLANAVGARQEAMQLQRELAQLENQYRYAALGQAGSQWNDRYGLERLALQNQMNRDALLAGIDGEGA